MTGYELIRSNEIKNRVHAVRGLQVLIDSDLAEMCQIEVKTLNQAVKRNLERFPSEFIFQLTADEYNSLRSQTVTPAIKN